MFEVEVKVKLKKGISDPEGFNTLKALHLLGFDNIKEAKTIRIFNLMIDETDRVSIRKDVEKMCKRLLTNPVIHDYEIRLIGEK